MYRRVKSVWRQCLLVSMILGVVFYILLQGIKLQIHNQMPGSMSRHRDSMAVAITYVQYGKWDGYASYRAINNSLMKNGLSVQQTDLRNIGLNHYFEVMTNPFLLEQVINKASTLESPESEGMFYMQDEKGMAILYILAFSLFGIHASSLFYLFISIFVCSIMIGCLTFRKHLEVVYLFLAVTCALAAITFILPVMPKQDINLIQSNRFLGLLSIPATFHILLLMLYKLDKSKINILLAILQTSILFMVINARTSVMWQLFAIIATWIGIWSLYFAAHKVGSKPKTWPAIIVVCGFCLFCVHQQFGYNSFFNSPDAQRGHVLWHNLVTALHNNPNRSTQFYIPERFPTYDDQVGYFLFENEITKRGESYKNYLLGNDDWVFRTTSPSLDFKWDAYDQVLKDVFVQTIKENPLYALSSFFVYQPLVLVQIIVQLIKINWQYLIVPGFVLLISSLVVFPTKAKSSLNLLKILAISLLFSLLPIVAAAVVELRVPEVFFMLIIIGLISFGIVVQLILAVGSLSYSRSTRFS